MGYNKERVTTVAIEASCLTRARGFDQETETFVENLIRDPENVTVLAHIAVLLALGIEDQETEWFTKIVEKYKKAKP